MILVNYRDCGVKQILFKGVISQRSLESWGSYQVLRIQAQDATYWIDIDRKNVVFRISAEQWLTS